MNDEITREVARAMGILIDAVANRVVELLTAHDESLISQRDRRGLQGRRHIAAVRRRVAEKAGGAFIRGRDYLLTPAAVREEFARFAVAPAPAARRASKAKVDESDEMSRLRSELEAGMRAARSEASGQKDAQPKSAQAKALLRELDAELAALRDQKKRRTRGRP